MHDPLRVRGRQPARHLPGKVPSRRHVEPTLLESIAEALALDELHRDEEAAVNLADLMHRRDVGVRDGRRRASFAQETLTGLRVLPGIGQQLQRYRAPQRLVLGTIDDTHAALTESPEDAEVRDGHRVRMLVRRCGAPRHHRFRLRGGSTP